MFKIHGLIRDDLLVEFLHNNYGLVKDMKIVPYDDLPVKEIVKQVVNLPVVTPPKTKRVDQIERFALELRGLSQMKSFTTATLKKAAKRIGSKPSSYNWYMKKLVQKNTIQRSGHGHYVWHRP